MTGLLGQRYINGKRLTDDRTQGTIFDQGFIVGSFGSGLNPKEFFSYARAGRTSLFDTALSTSQTGCSQRKLIKLMEKMVFHNDGSMRCVCSGRIYEEAFGGDGIDPCRRVLDPNWLKRAIYRDQAEDCQGKASRKQHVSIKILTFFSVLRPDTKNCLTKEKNKKRCLPLCHFFLMQ